MPASPLSRRLRSAACRHGTELGFLLPASYQQQGHGPYAPLPQILLAHSLCAPNVDDASVGNLIAPAPAPALVAATVPVHNASGDDFKLSHLCTEKRDLGRLYNGSRATSSIPPKIGF